MAEWFKAAVLKTASLKGDVGSNPTPSATNHVGFVVCPEPHMVLGAHPSLSEKADQRGISDIESGQIRQVGVERCPRGRRGSPAKRVSPLKGDRGFGDPAKGGGGGGSEATEHIPLSRRKPIRECYQIENGVVYRSGQSVRRDAREAEGARLLSEYPP